MIPYFDPPQLSTGPITINSFGVLTALGIYVGARLTVRAARRQGLDPAPITEFALWALASGLVAGHLVHLFLYHPEELAEPVRILRVWDGLSSFGGLLGGVGAAWVFFRRRGVPFHEYADAFALGIAPGWAVARLGCFTVHDHPGVLTVFPLAVAFPGGARHDLGLYEALVLFAISALLYALSRVQLLETRLLAVLALLYGLSRFFLDFLRATDVAYADARYGGLTPAQYGSVLLVMYAGWRFGTSCARSTFPSRR